MLDWVGLIANGLWIIALALALAALSFASWQGAVSRQTLRSWLVKPVYQIIFSLAGALFCTGLALAGLGTIQSVLWILLGVLFLVQMVLVVVPITRHSNEK